MGSLVDIVHTTWYTQIIYTFVLCSINGLWTRGSPCNLVLLQGIPFFCCLDLSAIRPASIGGPSMEEDGLITEAMCCPATIFALGTSVYKLCVTKTPNLCSIATASYR
jgi:hypothetical protein